jgi:hypothetical protein
MKIEPTNWLTTKISDFLVEHTPRCKDITRLLSASLDQKLPLRQRLGIRLHFLICAWCERYGEHLGWLRQWSREIPEHAHDMVGAQLSDAARDRLKRALREQS